MIEAALRDFITQTINECLGNREELPDFISIEAAAKMCDNVDRSVIDALIHDSSNNGFPAVRLGPRTIKIDRKRFIRWCNANGLNGINKQKV